MQPLFPLHQRVRRANWKNANNAAAAITAVAAAILSIEKQFGSGSIMKLGSAQRQQVDFIPTGSIALEPLRDLSICTVQPAGDSPQGSDLALKIGILMVVHVRSYECGGPPALGPPERFTGAASVQRRPQSEGEQLVAMLGCQHP